MEQIKELWDPEFAVNAKTTFIIGRFCHPPAVDVQTANTLCLILVTKQSLAQILVTIRSYSSKGRAVFACIFSKEAYNINFRVRSVLIR